MGKKMRKRKNIKGWRQPIIVDIPDLNDNPFAETIFQKILISCRNGPTEIRTDKGLVNLKRGECLFGRHKWNKKFGLPPGSKKVERELKNSPFLDRWVDRRIIHGKGSVLRVKNYDNWISMDRSKDTEGTRSGHLQECKTGEKKGMKKTDNRKTMEAEPFTMEQIQQVGSTYKKKREKIEMSRKKGSKVVG